MNKKVGNIKVRSTVVGSCMISPAVLWASLIRCGFRCSSMLRMLKRTHGMFNKLSFEFTFQEQRALYVLKYPRIYRNMITGHAQNIPPSW
jgi:hypothetical protein